MNSEKLRSCVLELDVGLNPWPGHLAIVWTWLSFLNSTNLVFLICEMGIVTGSTNVIIILL